MLQKSSSLATLPSFASEIIFSCYLTKLCLRNHLLVLPYQALLKKSSFCATLPSFASEINSLRYLTKLCLKKSSCVTLPSFASEINFLRYLTKLCLKKPSCVTLPSFASEINFLRYLTKLCLKKPSCVTLPSFASEIILSCYLTYVFFVIHHLVLPYPSLLGESFISRSPEVQTCRCLAQDVQSELFALSMVHRNFAAPIHSELIHSIV